MAAKGRFQIPSLEEMGKAKGDSETTAVRSLFQTHKSNPPQASITKPVVPPGDFKAASSISSNGAATAAGSNKWTTPAGATAKPNPSSGPSATSSSTHSLGGTSVPANSSGNPGNLKPTSASYTSMPHSTTAEPVKNSASPLKSNTGIPVTPTKPGSKTVSIIVNARQKGNPILKSIRSVPWEFGDIVGDYELGQTTCALFLSLRYHSLNPEYIHQRLKQLAHSYELRILLVQVDVKDPHHSLKELAKMCILADCTLILAFSPEEAGRYLETYKAFESKPPDLIKERTEGNFMVMVTDTLTSVKRVNKTDASTLLSTFGTVANIVNASEEDLSLCPGFGPQKARRLHEVMHEPFLKKKKQNASPQKGSRPSTPIKTPQKAGTSKSTAAKGSPLKQFLVKPSGSPDNSRSNSPKGKRIAHQPKDTS